MQTATLPLVSIIIPVYNGEKYIREAIDSALSQEYPQTEVIVIDDGSTDRTPAILESYAHARQITILTHENHQNRGTSYTRQRGIESASGEYIAFLDADDVFLPGKLKKQINALQQHPEAILCHTGIHLQPTGLTTSPDIAHYFNFHDTPYLYSYADEPYFVKEMYLCNSTVIVRTECVRGLPFAFKPLQYEDWLMWILLAEKGKFLYLPDRLIYYRYHPESATFRIGTNTIQHQYHRLELYLLVLRRARHEKSRRLAAQELVHILEALYTIYGEHVEHGIAEPMPPPVIDNIQQFLTLERTCQQLQAEVVAMKASKFWKLREDWLALKRLLPL